uniref:RNase H type-1 domain-containing protein n=1 Tax=Arundo donax TaxID=35708 RepID=A0A0A9D8Q3_ARUDO
MAHNSQALRMNLQRKGMEVDTRCVVCHRQNEDGAHLFFKCKFVRKIWHNAGLNLVRQTLSEIQSPLEVIQHILQQQEEVQVKILLLMWYWWAQHNKIREGEKTKTPERLVQSILIYAREVLETYKLEKRSIICQEARWSKPAVDILKINCDASFNPITNAGGWGFAIRDSDGDVIIAGRGRINHLIDAFQAEVIACLQGIQTAIEFGIVHVELETDALGVQEAVNSDDFDQSMAGGLISELKSLIMSNFITCSVKYVPRGGNKVAHSLATLGSVCSQGIKPLLVAFCIQRLVADDCAARE